MVRDRQMSVAMNKVWSHRTVRIAALVFGSALTAGTVNAKPLAPEICANIKSEIGELEGKGVRNAMAKGPAAARSMSAEQLAGVRRLLDLDSQSIFRCPLDRPYASLRDEPPEEKDVTEPEPGSGGVAVPTAAAAAAAAKAAQPQTGQTKTAPAKKAVAAPPPPAKVTPPAKTVPVPAAPTAAATAPVPPAPTPVAAPPTKARPKPKSPDAYTPPASGDPNATPLQDLVPKAQQ